jgi:hypothetical protein
MESNGATAPNPGLKALERLVGTWKVSGGTQGECTYEWMEGGHFLIQRGTITRPDGVPTTWMQIIGYERAPGVEPGDEIVGRLFTTDGDTLSYVSESDGDELTIWFGEKGSPAFYKGEWKDGGNTLEGEWTMPGDGGYKETMTRVE